VALSSSLSGGSFSSSKKAEDFGISQRFNLVSDLVPVVDAGRKTVFTCEMGIKIGFAVFECKGE
jgi:hypothetical protein